MSEIKTFITSFFYYSKLKKYFPDYKISRIKYAIIVKKCGMVILKRVVDNARGTDKFLWE